MKERDTLSLLVPVLVSIRSFSSGKLVSAHIPVKLPDITLEHDM